MRKQKMLDSVDQLAGNDDLRKMVKGLISHAYDVGFEDGMKRATEIQMKTFEMLGGAKS
jgi:hypothetical protein